MCENGWVENALNDVVIAINGGTLKLKMDDETKDLVCKLYRDLFSKKTEAEWRAARCTILDLAERAGRIAEVATLLSCVERDKDPGVHLERDLVMLVCMTVSRMDCPLNVTWDGKENPVKGGFCPHLKCSVPKEKGLILDRILTNLGYS